MSLWNHSLKLTEEQKTFAVDEAMNKIGTTRYKNQKDKYSKKLEEHGITDDITTTIDFDGCVNPIGAKAKNEYFNYVFTMMSDTQAHGTGEFKLNKDNEILQELILSKTQYNTKKNEIKFIESSNEALKEISKNFNSFPYIK